MTTRNDAARPSAAARLPDFPAPATGGSSQPRPEPHATLTAPAPAFARRLRAWLRAFLPAPVHVDTRERLRAMAGGATGILCAALLARLGVEGMPLAGHLAGANAALWLVAPIGASAVLVFGVPASPLAQPWSVVGGNTLSALVGIACNLLVPDTGLAAALAVGGAIGAMFWCRCLHPPGGASALFMVLAGATSFHAAFMPVFVDSCLLVAAGLAYNTLTGRRYPHGQALPPQQQNETPTGAPRFSTADLDAALDHYNQVLDVSRDDLEALLHYAEDAAYRRSLGELRCRDIMSTAPRSVEFGTHLEEAWDLMRRHKVKALPVIDRARRIIGIVTVADFMRGAGVVNPVGAGDKLRAFLARTLETHSEKPEVVGQIMTKQVRVASAERHVIELVPLFSHGGHHHIPIIDAERRLAGIITQSDLVRALYASVRSGAA
ncbi:MAG: putative rane protein [Betaproteobacteria bacterium]|nr:putative rane protein [Betaproteobacteria bacterium]